MFALLLCMGPWTINLTTLILEFLICETGMPTSCKVQMLL